MPYTAPPTNEATPVMPWVHSATVRVVDELLLDSASPSAATVDDCASADEAQSRVASASGIFCILRLSEGLVGSPAQRVATIFSMSAVCLVARKSRVNSDGHSTGRPASVLARPGRRAWKLAIT